MKSIAPSVSCILYSVSCSYKRRPDGLRVAGALCAPLARNVRRCIRGDDPMFAVERGPGVPTQPQKGRAARRPS